LPVPLAPALIVIQASVLTAVQLQLVPAVTSTEPVVGAADVRVEEVGAIVKVHGAPAWVTVKVRPPIVIVPLRDTVLVLAATL